MKDMKLAHEYNIRLNLNRNILFWVAGIVLLLGLQTLTAGEIVGRVTDRSTGQPLAGANILIDNTQMGASTDENGYYRISRVPSGTYTIEATYIGYKSVKYENVKVLINRITKLNFKLPPEALTSKEIVVQAERPAVDLEVASSAKVITADQAKNMPAVTNVKDLVALQSGVVKVKDAIHIRGGRSDEVLYLIDGVPARNPVTGINSVDIDINQIEQVEIITGGFDAEYGNANSGIINIITKSGRNKYTADVIYKGDHPFSPAISTNYDYSYVGISGPIAPFKWLGLPGESGFTLSAKTELNDTYYKIGGGYGQTHFLMFDMKNRQQSNYNISAQLNYQPVPAFRIKFQAQEEKGDRKNFNWAWSKRPQYLPINLYTTDRFTMLINQTITKNSFYNLNLGYTIGRSKTSLLGLKSPVDLFSYQVQYFDHEGNPIPADMVDSLLQVNPSYIDFSKTQAKYQRPPLVKDLDYDGFIDEGAYYNYNKNSYKSFTGSLDYTYYVGVHKFKSGIGGTLNYIDYLEINGFDNFYPRRDSIPGNWPEYGNSRWYFNDKTWEGYFYAQDRINYAGMFLNLGVRADLYGHGQIINDKNFIRQFNIATGEHVTKFKPVKVVWSPRLGLSIPANDKTKLFFNYGYFIQKPSFGELYRDPFLTSVVGNPNLDPRKSINYEVGMETEFMPNYVLNVKLYGRDYAGDIGYRQTKTKPVRMIYQNTGFGSARGFEIELRKTYHNNFSFTANYTYLLARGFDLSALDNYKSGSTAPPSVREQRVGWDINHSFKLMFNYEVLENNHITVFGHRLSYFGFYFLSTANLGRPYTPIIPHAIYVEPNSKNGPGEFYLDATLYKGFHFMRTSKFMIFIEAKNLLNIRNVNMGSSFNRRTGKVVNLGDLEGDSNRFLTPYQVRFLRANMAYSPGLTLRLGIKLYIR